MKTLIVLFLTLLALPAAAQSPGAKPVAPPSAVEATRIFTAAWKKTRPDFDIQSVEVLGSEAKHHQDRRWITYKLAVTATGTDKGSRSMYQKRYRCTPSDFSSVLKLEGGSWVADEKMIGNINESTECKEAK